MSKKLAATRDAYGKALVDLGREDPRVVVLDADLACSTKTGMFCKAFPDRFINCGVAEQDMIGTAAGLAACGKTAFASTFSAFASGRAWDQIKISVAYPRLNVKIVATHGGITVGEDGVTHQALEDLGIIRVMPNMTLIVPADSVEAYKAVKAAAAFNGPVYIRLSRQATGIVYEDESYEFKIGKSVLMRNGSDVSIIACGLMVEQSLVAAEQLEKEGISARVVNMHTLRPLDEDAVIGAAQETGSIVTAEEHQISGGLGSAVCEIVAGTFPVPVVRIGVKNTFAESGKPSDLLEKYGLTANDIIKAAKQAVSNKKR
ncbi:MAG: transketolase family protein [Candidatus Margulisiibacteriota bacterium]